MKRLFFAIAATILVAGAAAALWIVRPHSAGEQQVVDLTAWARLEADEPAPDFSLTDHEGRRTTLRDFAGKALVITFFFASCSDVCPTQLNSLDGIVAELSAVERANLALVGISIDPARDTPERLKAFRAEQELDENLWRLLTGTVAEATKAAADYGIVARPSPYGELVHNSVYILIDANGRERVEFHGIATPRAEVLKEIRAIITATPAGTGS